MKLKQRWSRLPMYTKLAVVILVASLCLPLALSLAALLGMPSVSFGIARLMNALGFLPDVRDLMYQPWGLLTYTFVHYDIYQLLINMLALWAVGKLFSRQYDERAILAIFLGGSLLGALSYGLVVFLLQAVGYNPSTLGLFGSSAGIYALGFALALARPRLRVRVPLLGQVNFLIGLLVLYTLSVALGTSNWGGIVAHLGGALYGIVWGLVRQQGGRDYPSECLAKLLPCLGTDAKESRGRRLQFQERDLTLERIMQKIRQSGYSSLSESERNYLQQYKK